MSICKKEYGRFDGKCVYVYSLNNNGGLTAEILTYGGIIQSLKYNGIDLVFGYDTLEEYLDNCGYFGAIIGRNSNRIENAQFELNQKVYKLNQNDGKNNHHGGNTGFNKKIWNVISENEEETSITLNYVSPDGEEGFPGEVNVNVTYALTKDNSLKIHYEATTDADTVVNLTNHSYFNLNGHKSGTIDKHSLWLASSFFTPNSAQGLPTGEVCSVSGTPLDFTQSKSFGDAINSACEQIKMFGGIDHNFALDGRGFRHCATVVGDKTGIKMELYTDKPGVQVYTENSVDEKRTYKENAIYVKHGAFCLETQDFPNNLKHSHFPSSILRKGEKFDSVTKYKFS